MKIRVWAKFDNMSAVGAPEWQASQVVNTKAELMKFINEAYKQAIPEGITVTFKLVPLKG